MADIQDPNEGNKIGGMNSEQKGQNTKNYISYGKTIISKLTKLAKRGKKKITSEPVVEDASDQTTESISENASNSQKHTIHVIDDSSNPSNHHVEAAAKYFSPPSSPHRGTYQYDVEEGLGEDFLKATYYFDDYNTQGCSIM